MGEKLLTAKEAAEILKVRKNTVYDMIKRGETDHCIRIILLGPVDHLTALSVCHICYRTGIYNIDIRCLFKTDNLVSCLFKNLLHGISLILIYFTAQCKERRSSFTHKNKSPFSVSPFRFFCYLLFPTCISYFFIFSNFIHLQIHAKKFPFIFR